MSDVFKKFFSKLSRVLDYYGLRKAKDETERKNLDYAERLRVLTNLRRTIVFTFFLIFYLLLILAIAPEGVALFPIGVPLLSSICIIALLAFVIFASRLCDSFEKLGAAITKKQMNKIRILYTLYWIIYYLMLIYCEFHFTNWDVGLAIWMTMTVMGFLVPVYSLQEGFIPMSTIIVSAVVLFKESGFEFKTLSVVIPAVLIVILVTDLNHVERINAFFQEGKTISESSASRRRLGNVFEEVYDMAYELNPQNETCTVLRNNNEYVVKHYSDTISFDEFVSNVPNLVHPDDVPTINRILNIDYLASEFSREVPNQVYAEARFLKNTDEYSWVSLLLTKERNVDVNYENATYVLCLIQSIEERKKNEDRLKLEAEKDPLTQLYNKMTTRSLIEECLEKNSSSQHALMIIDIDNFKTINDTRGHAVGDQILVAFANELGRNFRETDILGRAGGDEFVVLLKNIQSIALVCDKLQQLTSSFKKYGIDSGFPGRLSTSIGVAVFSKDGVTYEELFKKADAALYEAKRNGKDQYKFSITRT